MAKYVTTVGEYSIYELDEKECKQHFREYPTLVCWLSTHHEDIGNMNLTENEAETIEEMTEWCEEHSDSFDDRSEMPWDYGKHFDD